MPTSVPSIASKGRGKMWTSRKQKAQMLGLNTWPLPWHPNCWSCPLTLFERDLYWDPPYPLSTWRPEAHPSPLDTPPLQLGKTRQPKQRECCFHSPSMKINPCWAFQLKELAHREGGWGGGHRDRKGKRVCLQERPETHRNQRGWWWAVTHSSPHPVMQPAPLHPPPPSAKQCEMLLHQEETSRREL